MDCTLGEDCVLQQFVDLDPGPGAVDFAGGPLTYDGHRGTDLRLIDLAGLATAPPVVAPAEGVVRAVRDGSPDRIAASRAEVAGRECGNGVRLDHGHGWETQLCHLARGSILVAEGDVVARGQPIGRVGLSGATQFPHVHLGLRHEGRVVDPFVGGHWADPAPPYVPGGLLAAGFASAVPAWEAVKAGTAGVAPVRDAPALVVWAHLFGGRAGDVVEIVVDGPEGEIARAEAVLKRTQAQAFRAAGRRARGAWPAGDYRGRVRMLRDGVEIDRMEVAATLR
jgi:hypothetical protein